MQKKTKSAFDNKSASGKTFKKDQDNMVQAARLGREAEDAAANGRFREAVSIYERIVELNVRYPLLKKRLKELKRLLKDPTITLRREQIPLAQKQGPSFVNGKLLLDPPMPLKKAEEQSLVLEEQLGSFRAKPTGDGLSLVSDLDFSIEFPPLPNSFGEKSPQVFDAEEHTSTNEVFSESDPVQMPKSSMEKDSFNKNLGFSEEKTLVEFSDVEEIEAHQEARPEVGIPFHTGLLSAYKRKSKGRKSSKSKTFSLGELPPLIKEAERDSDDATEAFSSRYDSKKLSSINEMRSSFRSRERLGFDDSVTRVRSSAFLTENPFAVDPDAKEREKATFSPMKTLAELERTLLPALSWSSHQMSTALEEHTVVQDSLVALDDERRTLKVFELTPLSLLKEIELLGSCEKIVALQDLVFLMLPFEKQLLIYQIPSCQQLSTIHLSKVPADICVLPNELLLLANPKDGSLSLIDPSKLKEIQKVTIGGSPCRIKVQKDRCLVLHEKAGLISFWAWDK